MEPMRVAVIGRTGRGDWGHALDELWLTVPGTQLVAVADVGGARPAVLATVPVCVWLAGAATINADRQAVVLFAHGSRDPLWSRPIEAIALRMAALQLATKGIMNMIISWHSI